MPISNPGNQTSVMAVATTANKITNTVTTTAAEVVPLNLNRCGLTILNSHTSTVFFDIDVNPTSSDYMFLLAPGKFYEMPQEIPFTGAIHALAASDTGSLQIREFEA